MGRHRRRGTSNPLVVPLLAFPVLPMTPHAIRRRLHHRVSSCRPCLCPWIRRRLRRLQCCRPGPGRWLRAEVLGADAGPPRDEWRRLAAPRGRPRRRATARLHCVLAARPPGRLASPEPVGPSDAGTAGGWPLPHAAGPWQLRGGGAACGARQARPSAEPWWPAAARRPAQQKSEIGDGAAVRRRRRAANGPLKQ